MRKEINGTILIISHQERILNVADKIVLIADGTVSAIGSKEEIMPKLLGTNTEGTCKTLIGKGRVGRKNHG